MWNRHRESKNTKLYEIDSGTKLFITFELKVIQYEREAQSFYADFSICPPTTCSTQLQITGLVSVSSESQPNSSEARTQLTAFSQISKSSAHTSGHDVIHLPGPISYLGFYFDIWEWRILPARTWIPALMLHLTNPCSKWKVLSLTKPKGKIYKTKSLGNYITLQTIHLQIIYLIYICINRIWH